MKFTVSECTGQWLLVHSPGYATITTNSRTFSSLPKETHLQPISPLPQPLAIPSLLSVSTDLPVLDVSYRWNHTLCHLFFFFFF